MPQKFCQSVKELMKYRRGLDKTVPPKGGDKEYMPDGTRLQYLCLQNFYQERERALAEPRVIRSCDLVKGDWDKERRLVQLHREMRSFWEHMGFTDDKRKWLYPEEALFLMETNVMQVLYKSWPLSIQEGYSMFVDDMFPLEFYQVYSHLRRIGYVVLRHRGRLNVTRYEHQIHLDQYAPTNKSKHKNIKKCAVKTPSECAIESDGEKARVDVDMKKESITKKGANIVESAKEEIVNIVESSKKEIITKESTDIVESAKLTEDVTCEMPDYEITNLITAADNDQSDWSNKIKPDKSNEIRQWDFSEIVFPNFSSEEKVIRVAKPNSAYIPFECDFVNSEYTFEKARFINTKRMKKREFHMESDEKLDFSCPEIMSGLYKDLKTCKNWTEYKELIKITRASYNRNKMFPHFYGGDLEPLIRPEEATSTSSVLHGLQIIQDDKCSTERCLGKPSSMPQFDVYSPNTKFKKSTPGLPDFRVVVAKSTSSPPDLGTITAINSYLSDDVPLHFAVVDSGEIAFYILSDFTLSEDISLG